ncbi:Sapep family Mn(2+)-dependent dipeptidase [Mycoplasma bradburyae]|uniref:Sapep family Mn(2+)-dependent dipeptidase n=1 Tax=Mycoplasma bradburyae TaxID=2963128 RepID=UPI0020CC0F50|nr:Sapep family Mn(2+)-dependent dipeptidase [Mycoplasma bradburyae]UTS71091.1 Sapep family Mn(2+)-dependent dipeptidase [Mycoplasma bradburyae]
MFKKYPLTDKELNLIIEDIKNLCAIPSVSFKSNDPKLPYGKDLDDALNYVLNLAKSFDFRIYKDQNNRYGYCEIGNGSKLFGIMCHLDVVSEGLVEQWNTSAFEPIIKNNSIIARGTLDDKGPSIISLYVMKYLLDHNLIDPNWTIRIIFGLSEETDMDSMKHYIKEHGQFDFGFTPDGQWPVISTEKLIYDFSLIFNSENKLIINGGSVINQIADYCKISTSDNKKLMDYQDNHNKQLLNDGVEYIGVASHGSQPNKGINAIVNALKSYGKVFDDNQDLIKYINDNYFDNHYALNTALKGFNDFSGEVTANIGTIFTKDDMIYVNTNLRVPVTYTTDDVKNGIINYLKENKINAKFELIDTKPTKNFDLNSPLLKLMLDCYEFTTNKKDPQPKIIGGGTYAKLVDNCVAFGPAEDSVLMHAPNECITFDEIKVCYEVYINAIINLIKTLNQN